MQTPILIYNGKQGREYIPGMLKKQNYIIRKQIMRLDILES